MSENKRTMIGIIKKYIKEVFFKVIKHKRLRNLWIFGLILIVFSIFINIKLIVAILLLIIFLTAGTMKNMEYENLSEIELLEKEKTEVEDMLKVMKEHIETGNANLEEKLEYKETQEYLEEINKLIEEKNNEK